MPKDKRLYMTFPNDFWMHPKIAPLSDAAFRAFVELNGYSRMQDLDGRVPVAFTKRRWKPRALAELLANHPDRPSLSVEGDEYVIWNYAEHQFTTGDLADLHEKRAKAGSKGGKAKASAIANAKQNVAESESGTETTSTDVDVSPRKRGNRIPDPFIVDAQMRAWATQRVPGVNVDTSTEKFVNYWRSKTRDATKLDWRATWDNWLISDFERLPVNKPTPTERARRVLATEIDMKEIGA